MDANNVIDFTDKWASRQIKEYEDSLDEINSAEYSEYDQTLGYFYDEVLDICQEAGIASDEDEFVRDFSYVMEAVKSMIDRQFNYEHNFHKVVDKKLHVSRDNNGDIVSIEWVPTLTKSEE